jgi:two-component system OmpR family response regulator
MKTVLLTDDNEDIIELVELILAKSGYNLKVAHGGKEALKICTDTPPDLVLMDLRMTDMDGFTVIKTLRDNGFKNPIIVLTGSESAEDKKRAFAAGCDDYIIKTMEMRDLEHTIDRFLQKGGGL